MRSMLAPLIGLQFLVALFMPSLVLLQFQMDRARIERELCVQRDLMEGMRTCHGECQLSKRFQALEREAEAGFPAERVLVRFEPVVDIDRAAEPVRPLRTSTRYPRPQFGLCAGFGYGVDHVPRVLG